MELHLKAKAALAQLKSGVARNQSATTTATKAKPGIIYNGVEYPTVQAAADAHGISRQAMTKRLAKYQSA